MSWRIPGCSTSDETVEIATGSRASAALARPLIGIAFGVRRCCDVSSIQTNRDLYLAIADLTKRHSSGARDLEDYLRALWASARCYHERASLSADEFFELLSAAFTLPAPHFDEAWRSQYAEAGTNPLATILAAKLGARHRSRGADEAGSSGFDSWETFVLRQIVDLREMAEQGILADEQRYFGINSPRGHRWYNFNPCAFLECAAAGSSGGWQSGDDPDREFVPGQVAVLANDGTVTTADSQDVADPVVLIREMSWKDFESFLGCGQWYE